MNRSGIAVILLAVAAAGGTGQHVAGRRTTSVQDPDMPRGGPPPFGPGGPGMSEEQKLVHRFDVNKNGRLDADERKAAREWLSANRTGRSRFGRRGMPSGRGSVAPGEPAAPSGRAMSGSPGRTLTPVEVRTYASESLYDPTVLRTIFLQFESAEWERELTAFHNTDIEVPATAIVDGRTYRDVGVHFRGQSSFMMVPDTLKRSLNLSFDFVHAKQAVGGFRTLNLLNAASDPTFVRGVLYSEIARSYIPAPRINYVRVVINGESWGIYLNAQQFNKDFLRDFYKTENGARWKVPGRPGGRGGMEFLGDETDAYEGIYEIKSKDDSKAWAGLIRMFRVLNEIPVERLEAELSPLFDIDGALKFLAVEMALINSDGYWTRASDYNIYQDPGGKFHVIPHDMNEPLLSGGGPGRRMPRGSPPQGNSAAAPPDGRVGGPPDPPWPMPMGIPPWGGRGFGPGADGPDLNPLIGMNDASKPLRSKLLAVPALRAQYLGYVRDIAGRWLEPSKLRALAVRYQALIAEDVVADTRKLYSTEAFRTGLDGPNGLMELVKARRDYLLKVTGPQAAAPARPDPTGRNRR